MQNKVFASFADAIADIQDGASVMLSGFAGPGTPHNLLRSLYAQGTKDLTLIANSATGSNQDSQVNISVMVEGRRVKKAIMAFTAATHPSRRSPLEILDEAGEVETETVPQGTLAERMRAAGAGIPAFYTPAAVDTELAEGKEHRVFNGRTYLMEEALSADFALIRAWKADEFGNLKYRLSERNFGPLMAMAARCTIVEVEEIVPTGSFEPDEIHTPGLFVHRIVQIPPDGVFHATRLAPVNAPTSSEGHGGGGKEKLTREFMAARIAAEFQPGWIANLGVGMPTMCSDFIPADRGIILHAENGVIGYGRLASDDEADPHLVNAGGQAVVLEPYASIVHHSDSFAVVRSGMLDVAVLGAYEVGANGDLANWKTAGRKGGGIGGAMDIAACAKNVFIMMEHTLRDGTPRLLPKCTLPITAPGCVKLVMTDLGLLQPAGDHFILKEIAPGYTVEEVAALTGAPLVAAPDLKVVEW